MLHCSYALLGEQKKKAEEGHIHPISVSGVAYPKLGAGADGL